MNRGAMRECHIEEHKVNGICVKCSSGYGHSPRIQFYDRRAGDYVTLEGDLCTARWATTGVHNIEGEVCCEPATEKVGDFLLCEYHRDRLFGWEVKRKLWGIAEIRDAQIAADKERIQEAEAARGKYSIVYYLRRESDGMIKIGSTRRARSRFSELKTSYGPLRLLATHGGELREERDAQYRYDEFLAEGKEWFRPAPRLLRHILRVRTRHEVHAGTRLPVAEIAEIRAMIRVAVRSGQTALAVRPEPCRDGFGRAVRARLCRSETNYSAGTGF